MSDRTSRRGVLRWFAAMVATLAGTALGGRAGAAPPRSGLERVDDVPPETDAHEAGYSCACSCRGSASSSTYSNTASSGRRRRK